MRRPTYNFEKLDTEALAVCDLDLAEITINTEAIKEYMPYVRIEEIVIFLLWHEDAHLTILKLEGLQTCRAFDKMQSVPTAWIKKKESGKRLSLD